MRIVAIDASPTKSVVTVSVETAARAAETAGAQVQRVHLSSLKIRSCTNCGMCRYSGSCKIEDDLPVLAQQIADADGVILGLPSYFRHPDESVKALLDRLKGFFPDDRQLRLPGLSERDLQVASARAQKRAVIITACNAPEPLATFFGYTTGPVRELRSSLAARSIRTVGSLAIAGGRHSFDTWEEDKARSLGRLLAGKTA
ncbi:MAG: flavodoxin family protein [Coriobacteriia bacterium]